ncbi:MAG: hypothetical protein WC715_00745 [Patescibacteria group bacterium]|jgi:hypothetical protein
MKNFNLDDLNELSPQAGDKVRCLLDGVRNWSSLLDAEKRIKELLSKIRVKAEEVFINKGMAEGLHLNEALKQARRSCKHLGRFHNE